MSARVPTNEADAGGEFDFDDVVLECAVPNVKLSEDEMYEIEDCLRAAFSRMNDTADLGITGESRVFEFEEKF